MFFPYLLTNSLTDHSASMLMIRHYVRRENCCHSVLFVCQGISPDKYRVFRYF